MNGGLLLRISALVVLHVALAVGMGSAAHAESQKEQDARIARLQDAVLAPCCYTEPVSRHQSEIALKMRIEIAKWVTAGKTDREILGAYIDLYGSKVLVDPRSKPGAWTPWVPWLTLILAMAFGCWLLRHWRAAPVPAGMSPGASEPGDLPDFEIED